MSDSNIVGSAYVSILPSMTGFADSLLGGAEPGLGALKHLAAGALIGAFAEFTAKSVEMASGFQQTMTKLETEAHVPQAQIKALTDGVLTLAGKVGFDPDSLAQSLYHVESSFASVGITAPKALSLVEVAAKGAKIGGADLVDVTNALDAAVVSGIPGVGDYNKAMGALLATVGSGDMQMQDLADAFSTGVLSAMKEFGLSITDVGAALAVFGDNNIRGQVAATDLRMAVQDLPKPTKDGAKMLADMGLAAGQLTKDLQTGGLLKALEDLKGHMNDAGVTGSKVGPFLEEVFTKKAGTGLAILVDQLDRLKSKYVELGKGANGFGLAWQQQQATFKQVMDDFKGRIDALMVRFGLVVIPLIEKVGKFLGDAFDKEWPKVQAFFARIEPALYQFYLLVNDAVRLFIDGFDGKKMTARAQPLLDFFYRLGAVVRDAIGFFEHNRGALLALGAAVGTIVAPWLTLAVAVVYVYEKVSWFRTAVNAVVNFIDEHLKPILIVAGLLIGALVAPIALLVGALVLLLANWQAVSDWFEHSLTHMADFFKEVWGRIAGDITNWWDDARRIFDEVVDFLDNVFGGPWRSVTEIWDAGMQAVIAVLTPAFEAVKTIIQVALTWIGAFVSVWVGFVEAAWNVLATMLVAVFQYAWTVVTAIVKVAWDLIVTILKAAIKIFWDTLGVFLNLFTGNWKALWQSVSGIFSAVWSVITHVFKDTLGLLVTILVGWAKLVGTFFYTFAVNMWKWASGAWDTLTGALKKTVSDVLNFFKALPGEIVNEVEKLASALETLGEHIVGWIVGGIENVGGGIAKAILSHIPGGSAVANALGLGGSEAPNGGVGGVSYNSNGDIIINGVDTAQAAQVAQAASSGSWSGMTGAISSASRTGVGAGQGVP